MKNIKYLISGWIVTGIVIAIILSWIENQSALYAVLHALLGWFYIGFWILNRLF